MHVRLRGLLRAGARDGSFRRVDATDFYRLVTSALLIRLVFPSDDLLVSRATAAQIRSVQRGLWQVADGYLAPRPASPDS